MAPSLHAAQAGKHIERIGRALGFAFADIVGELGAGKFRASVEVELPSLFVVLKPAAG
jgi:hypothetical protein